MSGLVVIVAGCVVARMQLVDELLDPILAGDPFIVDESQLRDAPKAEPRSHVTAKKWRGSPERALGVPPGGLVTEHRIEHARELEIRGHHDARNGHESHAGIVDLPRQQLSDLSANLISDAIRARSLRHFRRETRSPCG